MTNEIPSSQRASSRSWQTRSTTLRALAFTLFLASCGGGGGGGSGGGSPPPPPPPPPAPNAFRPEIFLERDPDGTPAIRVLEQIYNPFAPGAAQRAFSNTSSLSSIDGPLSTAITNAHVTNAKYGIQILGTGVVSIYDYSSVGFNGGGSIHGAALKIDRSSAAATYIQRVFGDEQLAPDPTYSVANVDFLGVEHTSAPIYMRGATGRNVGDAGVDTKSGPIYMMNVSISNAYRGLRVWGGAEIVIVNSIINAPPVNSAHAWIFDNTSTIRYHNVLWCVGAINPTPIDPACSTSPTLLHGENITPQQAALRVIAEASNPLPAVHPFFATQIDQIVVEYSTDGGGTWQIMSTPNAGGAGSAPVGDTRYAIPLNLNTANYMFRASFRRNGAMVGEVSARINEAGQVVP